MHCHRLARVIDAEPGRPNRPGAARTQDAARHLADHPSQWSPEAARKVVDEYRDLARNWDSERGSYRPVPLRDALARGGPFPAGPCLEIGAGTGLLTGILGTTWPRIVSVDLSPDMLARSRALWRVRCDASALPVPGDSMAAALVADAPLFAAELVRVLRPDGVIVWTNALGDAAPHYLPCEVVLEALARTGDGADWTAVTSVAGWGSWAVFRRGAASER